MWYENKLNLFKLWTQLQYFYILTSALLVSTDLIILKIIGMVVCVVVKYSASLGVPQLMEITGVQSGRFITVYKKVLK